MKIFGYILSQLSPSYPSKHSHLWLDVSPTLLQVAPFWHGSSNAAPQGIISKMYHKNHCKKMRQEKQKQQ